MTGEPNNLVERRLEELRRHHIGRLLLQAQRSFNARAVEKLRGRGYSNVTLAHISLFQHLDAAGTRITTLADRAGMTKQGMGQLVKELERQGLVTRQQDLDDRRAANVRFTQSGLRFLGEAVAVTQELDAEYRAILGDQQMDNLLHALRALTTPEQI